MVLVACILAAFIGTGLMTISSETEAALSGREPSQAPGKAVSRLARLFGAPPLEGTRLAVASTWGHWLYGTAWGVLLWMLVDPELAGLSLGASGLILFGVVMLAAQVVTPALAGAKPSVASGLKATLTESWHHAVYAGGAAFALWLMAESGGWDGG